MIGYILGNDNPTENQFYASDVNGDQIINVLDIMLILDIIFEN